MLGRLCVLFIFVFALQAFLFSPQSFAQQELNPDEYEEDYDFSWLDPDKKIYVIQNRKYLKGRHVELMLSLGPNLSGPYSDGFAIMGRGAYYFNEQWGVSLLFAAQSNSESDTLTELKSVSNAFPGIRDITSFFGGSVIWVPFYGKLNLFNKIFYIDWPLELGIVSVATDSDLNTRVGSAANIVSTTHTGFFWSTGFKFFLSRLFALRLDALGVYYSAPEIFDGSVSGESKTYDNYYLTLGLSVHL